MLKSLLLTTTLLAAADLRIDHVTVSGMDLKKMQAALASVGIASEYGGAHSNGATEMAIASFKDGSYLELIAMQPNADQAAASAHYWSKQIRGNAGPTAWAVRSKDVAAEAARLRTAGIAVSAPSQSGRARPDGLRLDWETARVGEEPNGTFFPFLIRDIGNRDARAFPKGQPSAKNYPGVARVIIAVRDLKKAEARYRQAYGLPAPVEQDDAKFGAHLASFEGTPVILAVPLSPGSWLTSRLDQFGEGPCAFVLGSVNITSKIRWLNPQILGWRLGVQ